MKPKDIIFFTLVTILVFLCGAYLVFQNFSNERLQDVFLGDPKRNSVSVTQAIKCSQTDPLANLESSSVLEAQVLGAYQANCNSFVSDTLMIFVGMQWVQSPNEEAQALATRLLELKRLKIKPIVIMEPYLQNSVLLDWKQFVASPPLASLQTYLQKLQVLGVTDADFGTLVPFPEPNVPNWGPQNGDGEIFVKSINFLVGTYKKVFPKAKASVLINSQSYPADDVNWENGDYIPLNYYLTGIQPGLIDSLGVQGFPWITPSDAPRKRELYEPNEFLSPGITVGAAKILRVRDIWFNTGTFGLKYTNDEAKRVIVPAADRRKVASAIFDVTESLVQAGYRISLNIFAADKTKVRESTDWSYLRSPEYQVVFRDIVREAYDRQLPISMATL